MESDPTLDPVNLDPAGPEASASPGPDPGMNGSDPESNGRQPEQDGRPSIAERLMSSGARRAQRVVDAAGLDQAIESAVEEAIVRAIESEATERAIARVLNGPLIEQAVSEALRSPEVEAAIIEVLDSQTATEVWDHVLDGPHTQRLIERIAEAPEVRAAIAAQGIGLIGDLGSQVSRATRVLDFIGERVARRVLFRPKRTTPSDRAGFFTRALGISIDALIVNLGLVVTGALLGAIASFLGISSGDTESTIFAVGAALWFLSASLYLFTFWALSGQTPGMRFLDIQIERDGNHRIGPRAAFRRLVGFWLSVASLGLVFVGVLIRIDRRGFLDRLAGTVVYFVDPANPERAHEHPVL